MGLVPEERLHPMITGAVLLPNGIFWLSWSSNYPEHVHWIVPTISGIVTECVLMLIFLPSINYITDTYLIYVASAIAVMAFLRLICVACFPLFVPAMFRNLGTNWAGTVIGCIAVVMTPVPIRYYYEKMIRQKSKFAYNNINHSVVYTEFNA